MKKIIQTVALLACILFLQSEGLNAACQPNQAWVADLNGTMVILSTETQSQISSFTTGGTGATGLVFTPDGSQVFLTQAQGIFAIDTTSLQVTNISTQVDCSDIAMNPNGQLAYVAVSAHPLVQILQVNTSTHAVTTFGPSYVINPDGIAISPDGSQLYLVGGDTILVLDSTTGNVVHTITVPLLHRFFKVAFTPNGAFAYVTDLTGNVFQIDTTSFAVAPVSVGAFTPFGEPTFVAINPNGQFAYVTDFSNNSVYVIQISSNTVVNLLTDPSILGPTGIAVTPDGNFIYVADSMSPSVVSAINSSTFAIHDINTTAFGPNVIAMAPLCQIQTNIKGRIVKNKDFWQTNVFSQLCWDVPASFTPVQYLIFRNGKQVGVVNADRTFFEDNYLRSGKTYDYSIFAVNDSNMEILVGTVTLST